MEDSLLELIELIKSLLDLSLFLKQSKLEDFLIESGSEFHAMAALCLIVSLPISDLGLGNSIFMDFLRQ